MNSDLRIGFMGEDYWAQHLSDGLNARFPRSVDCRHVASYTNPHALRDTLRLLRHSDVVIRVGFPPTTIPMLPAREETSRLTPREQLKRKIFKHGIGRAIRAAVLTRRLGPVWRRRAAMDYLERWTRPLRRRSSTVYYWIGSDVLLWLERSTVDPRMMHRARTLGGKSLAGADHLSAELRSLGVDAETVMFPGVAILAPEPVPDMPGEMTVVSYIPAERGNYYGLPDLLEAARALPDVRFRFFGGAADTGDAPSNVEFLGRVDDLASVYAASSIVVRLVRHDAIGATVTEGLFYARTVLYSFPLPHTMHVPFGDPSRLVSTLRDLQRLHIETGIPLNLEGREWARAEFDVDRRFRHLHDVLAELLASESAEPA